ncbi:MAG: class I SAM-dependent methyltransferase [Coleofasciculaceae cyanobacterium]
MTYHPFDFDSPAARPATEYDTRVRHNIPGYDALLSMVAALFQQHLPNNAHILVVGAGGGNELQTLSNVQSHWQFTGVDPSENMLAVARSKVEQLGISERVTLYQGMVDGLPLQQFDAATSLLVMHFLPDDGSKLNYLQAIAARLKPGSPFLLVDMQGDKQSDSFKLLFAGWQTRARLAGMEPERLTELACRVEQHLPCIPESRTLELLAQAKFKNVARFYTAFIVTGWLAFAE